MPFSKRKIDPMEESDNPTQTSSQEQPALAPPTPVDDGQVTEAHLVPPPVSETLSALPIQEPVAKGLAMKRRNPWLVWLVWPLITLSVYHLVWYYKIHKEMAEFDRRRAIPIAGPMLVLLFLGWTLVAPFVSYYNCGTRIRNAQRSAGLVATCTPWIGTALMLLLGAGTTYYQVQLNKICDSYQAGEGQEVPLYV